MKTKQVFLSGGEEAELLGVVKDNNHKLYVVKVFVGENCYEGEYQQITENQLVDKIYKNYKDTPAYFRQSQAEKKIIELNKKIQQLQEQQRIASQNLKSVYAPKLKIGDIVYYTQYGCPVEELKVREIQFTEREEQSFYAYSCSAYRTFQTLGTSFFLKKKEAEKALKQYHIQNEKDKLENIKKNYEKAKQEYDNAFVKQLTN